MTIHACLKSAFAGGLLAVGLLAGGGARAAEALNALVWCDHTDPELLKPFEDANGVKVNTKTFEGTGSAISILQQSQKGDWDVLVVDSTDVGRVAAAGLLEPLDPAGFPWDDIPEKLRDPKLHYVDGKLYAVPEKFGYNAIAYNKEKVDPADMRDPAVMWNPKYKNRIAIYDYYMSIIGKVALALGIDPSKLTMADLPAIREKLVLMKENAAMLGEVATVQSALANGEVDIVIGGGEYAVAGIMHEKPQLDWVLSNDGGTRWEQAIAMVAGSKKKELARKFLAYIVSPEGQARLATSACYWGMPVNMKAALTDEQKKILRWDEQPAFLAKSYPYPAPDAALDKAMQDLWQDVMH
ncbi:spermidine/putrescine ABC transporter substrate-binding protein [Zavarzinia sp.]|uniref:polyamine ABC transporter substrate-binding protein n=1 Tax=Zavarzinia sp. TaxID=2027920 RepID=UPI0035682711